MKPSEEIMNILGGAVKNDPNIAKGVQGGEYPTDVTDLESYILSVMALAVSHNKAIIRIGQLLDDLAAR